MIEFYILGDMGSGLKSQTDVVSGMLDDKIHLKDTFVCGLGDNIYENGCYSVNDVQFSTKFEKPYDKIPDSIKFYMCLGNHDYGYEENNGYFKQVDNSKHQVHYGIQSQEIGGKWYMPHNYYQVHKQDGDVSIDFFVMDSNFDVLSKQKQNEQYDDLKQWINSSRSDWKILIGHHTWKSVGDHGGENPDFENYLYRLFTEAPFDIYMCGHDHIKQVSEYKIQSKTVTLIVCGTGGALLHGRDLIDFNNKNIDDYDFLFLSTNLGFGNCQATKRKLTFTFKNEKNKLEFIYDLLK